MRVAFAGTPPFAARALEALVASGHDVALVFTQPDRPAGRGMRVTASAVAHAAEKHGISTLKPASLKGEDAARALAESRAEAMIVAAYGLIIPAPMLAIPPRGCINIHASLLPRWRGAAPIQRAILAGDAATGISIMQMDPGLDTGPVLLQHRVEIDPRETAGTLTEKLALLGASSMIEALSNLDGLRPQSQESERATYAPKIEKTEARVDWTQANVAIDRRIRAFNPTPGTEARIEGETIKVWEAVPASGAGAPGEILVADGVRLVIACGEGALDVREVQRPGGKRMPVRDYLQGAARRPVRRI